MNDEIDELWKNNSLPKTRDVIFWTRHQQLNPLSKTACVCNAVISGLGQRHCYNMCQQLCIDQRHCCDFICNFSASIRETAVSADLQFQHNSAAPILSNICTNGCYGLSNCNPLTAGLTATQTTHSASTAVTAHLHCLFHLINPQ